MRLVSSSFYHTDPGILLFSKNALLGLVQAMTIRPNEITS